MQDKWKEMYKSVEKSKDQNDDKKIRVLAK